MDDSDLGHADLSSKSASSWKYRIGRWSAGLPFRVKDRLPARAKRLVTSRVGGAIALALLLSTSALMGCKGSEKEEGPPNILILCVDDLGNNDLRANGNPKMPTPQLDQLAHQGVRFTRHYADSTCSPARAALLSGRFPSKSGFTPNGPGLSPQVVTLPRALKELGYRTHHVGKWHMGHISPLAWPDSVGFDSWFGFLSQWLLRGPYQHPPTDEMFHDPSYVNPWLNDGPNDSREYRGHLTDILIEKSCELIRAGAKRGEPWFLNHWFYLPHTPIEPARRYAEKYDDSPDGRYLAMIEHLDDSVGALLRALEESGQENNTFVVVASDNGGTNKQLDNNWPFFGKKAEMHEGSLRTPMLMRWPVGLPSNRVIDHTVSLLDVFPTVLRAAGGDVEPSLDGVDLTSLVRGERELRGRPLFWEQAVFDRYGFGVLSADGRWRMSSHFLAWPVESSLVLNDLESDPAGKLNVADQHPGQAMELLNQYKEWFRAVHQVELQYKETVGRKGGVLEGDDLQRTPGHGSYSFGIAVAGVDKAESEAVSLVEQAGVWSVEFSPASRTVSVVFGDYRLEGRLDNDSGAQSIIFAGDFYRRLSSWKGAGNRIRASLYVNGELVDEMDEAGHLEVSDYQMEPTRVGDSTRGPSFGGSLGTPRVFNAVVSARNFLPPEPLHRELCAELQAVVNGR